MYFCMKIIEYSVLGYDFTGLDAIRDLKYEIVRPSLLNDRYAHYKIKNSDQLTDVAIPKEAVLPTVFKLNASFAINKVNSRFSKEDFEKAIGRDSIIVEIVNELAIKYKIDFDYYVVDTKVHKAFSYSNLDTVENVPPFLLENVNRIILNIEDKTLDIHIDAKIFEDECRVLGDNK